MVRRRVVVAAPARVHHQRTGSGSDSRRSVLGSGAGPVVRRSCTRWWAFPVSGRALLPSGRESISVLLLPAGRVLQLPPGRLLQPSCGRLLLLLNVCSCLLAAVCCGLVLSLLVVADAGRAP